MNKVYKEEDKIPQMKNWSIFSDNIRCVKHDEKTPTQIRPQYIRLPTAQRAQLQIEKRRDFDFGINPETLKTNYSDIYEGIHAAMIYTDRFDENSDLSMTYLG